MRLTLKTRGIKGGSFAKMLNKGQIIAFIDSFANYISVDAYKGQGDSYEKREECEIEISKDGKIWKGTFEELFEKLK